jgi:hypothetical protein
MRNRAKCKLCNSVLESIHVNDYVTCKCGEISIGGGDQRLECFAVNFDNFLRVDDEGNEIIVTVEDSKKEEAKSNSKMNKKELLNILDEMRQKIEDLPIEAALSSVTNADLASLMMLLSAIFRADCIEES